MSPPIPVLLVAHQMPPLGGPGTRRPASWVREWPALGIEPLVLCAPAGDGARFHGYPIVEGSDAGLADRTVVRVPTPAAGGAAGWLRALHAPARVVWSIGYHGVREPETPWGRPAIDAGVRLGRERRAAAVVSTSQPYEAHRVGRAIARALDVPWVADFRDPMTEAEGRSWPTRLHWWLERREERRLFRDADRIWATCDSAAERWRARFPEAAAKILVRRNGIGPGADAAFPAAPEAPPFRIGHIGRFTDSVRRSRLAFLESRPGGRGGGGSSPAPLFLALERLLARRPDRRGRIVWMTVGSGPTGAPPAGVVVESHPPVGYDAALRLAATCHALYLPLTRPNRFGSQFVQQKVYEYAAVGRPVLVTGAAGETVERLGSLARLAAPGDVDALARLVDALVETGGAAPAGAAPPPPRQSDVALACARDLEELVTDRGPSGRPRAA